MNLAKLVSLSIALLLIQACSHPIEIEGQGDVMSASGTRTCLLEDFQAGEEVCKKNYVIGAYQETYMPSTDAHPGWHFNHWEPYCTTATPPNYDCPFSATAPQVGSFWGQTMPALKAVFVTQCGDGIKAGIEGCDDGDVEPGYLCTDTCTTTPDTDLDGVADATDNCPAVPNTDQKNFDNDSEGDACDADDDNDEMPDVTDPCPLGPNTGEIGPSCIVTALDGKEWAQPTLFTSLTWNQINAVCPSGSCVVGGQLNGHTMTGWKWAGTPEVAALFNAYGVSPPLVITTLEALRSAWPLVDAPWAHDFFQAGFIPIQLNPAYFRGLSARTNEVPFVCGGGSFTCSRVAFMVDYTNGTLGQDTDRLQTGQTVTEPSAYNTVGAWFYKP